MKRLNAKQLEWATNYQNTTGFDALLDDFRAGNQSFVDAAKNSVRWFEDWSSDAYLTISRDIPGLDQ